MVESSEEWLAKQKEKFRSMKNSASTSHQNYNNDNNNGFKDSGYSYYSTSSSHGGTSHHDKKQLVEEMRTKQSSFKQEKTEKITERIEEPELRESSKAKTVYRMRSSSPPLARTLHPVVISDVRNSRTGGGENFRETRYHSETKHVEEKSDHSPPRRYYRPAPPQPIIYYPPSERSYRHEEDKYHHATHSSTRHEENRSEGYNTLTSESDDYGRRRYIPAVVPRHSSRRYYHDDIDYFPPVCHTINSARNRSRSFADTRDDLVWRDAAYYHKVGDREYAYGDINPSRPAAEVFREALRNVGPDGEIIYTSRTYDRKTRDISPVVARGGTLVRREYIPVHVPVPAPPPPPSIRYVHQAPAPLPPPPPQVIDDEVTVTETYKRTREVRTDAGTTVTEIIPERVISTRIEQPPLQQPQQAPVRYYTPPPVIAQPGGVTYCRRRVVEEDTYPVPIENVSSSSLSNIDSQQRYHDANYNKQSSYYYDSSNSSSKKMTSSTQHDYHDSFQNNSHFDDRKHLFTNSFGPSHQNQRRGEHYSTSSSYYDKNQPSTSSTTYYSQEQHQNYGRPRPTQRDLDELDNFMRDFR